MGFAFECDSCGKFFRYEPKYRQFPIQLNNRSWKNEDVSLCKACVEQFDKANYEMAQTFVAAKRRRKEIKVSEDKGSEGEGQPDSDSSEEDGESV